MDTSAALSTTLLTVAWCVPVCQRVRLVTLEMDGTIGTVFLHPGAASKECDQVQIAYSGRMRETESTVMAELPKMAE